MSAGRSTSRVFAVERAIFDRLREAPWPAHPATGELPGVLFGELSDSVAEHIVVHTDAEAAFIEWARLSPPGADEQFTVNVTVNAWTPVESSLDVHERLNVLCDIVQNLTFDPVAERTIDLGYDGEIRGIPARASTPTGPIFRTQHGWAGTKVVPFPIRAEI
jgi:hypothetical protein